MEQNDISDAELQLACTGRFSASECALLAAAIPSITSRLLTVDDVNGIIGKPSGRRHRNVPDDAKLLAYIRRMMSYYSIQCVRFGQPSYPRLLAEIYDPPFLLFYRGDCNALNRCCAAIVGTRRPTPEGFAAAFQAGKVLAQNGLTVVSGLAFGVDTAAHKGALAADGITAAVMAGGLESISPRSNRELATRIIETGGVLVSEYAPGTPMSKYHFPQRNRIISGLSNGVFVAQAPKKSGALITADFAVEQNRGVYVQKSLLDHPSNDGCCNLSYEGSTVFETPEELLGIVQNEIHLTAPRADEQEQKYSQRMLFDE